MNRGGLYEGPGGDMLSGDGREVEDPVERCPVCNWPLSASVKEGCVPGKCAARPSEPGWLTRKSAQAKTPPDPRDQRIAELTAERDALKAELAEARTCDVAVCPYRADTERLDWLESKGDGSNWIARESETGRGYRLHNTSRDGYPTARAAIDAARKGDAK